MLRDKLQKVAKAVKDPRYALQVTSALLRGSYYILYYRLFRKNVRIRFPFKAFAHVTIVGPGSVSIEPDCSVFMTLFRGLTIVTLSPESEVRIGRGGNLGGLTIRCRTKIRIGEGVRTAAALVQDVFFLDNDTSHIDATESTGRAAKPITIGNNVWLAAVSVTLGGSTIGNDSVVGAGAVCCAAQVGDAQVLFGNPGKRPLPIDRLLQLKGEL